jgi:hypothetical protein
MTLSAADQVKDGVLEGEIEVGMVKLLVLQEPFEGLLDRLPKIVAWAPADIASEFVSAEHQALIPAV